MHMRTFAIGRRDTVGGMTDAAFAGHGPAGAGVRDGKPSKTKPV